VGGEGGTAGEGAVGGAGGEGGAGSQVPQDFLLTFDANVNPLAIHGAGFSPGPGGSGGPAIMNSTMFTWEADAGVAGGAAKISVPFSVATQQADISAAFATPADLTGYELLADVKLTTEGTIGDCPTAWMYVYGANGYANDAEAEPALGETNHLTPGEWTTVRLDLDGPYGHHATDNFTPTQVTIWGIQFNTWGCE
jgi:hypothetical protein